MTDEFNDFEEDDAWDEEPADPEQVAKHLHEMRVYLADAVGAELAAWDALPEADRQIGTALAERLIEVCVNDPDHAPKDFHETLAFFQAQPEWEQLDEGAREIGVALIVEIVNWMNRQGSLR